MGKLTMILGALGALVASGWAVRRRRMHREAASAPSSYDTGSIPGQFTSPPQGP